MFFFERGGTGHVITLEFVIQMPAYYTRVCVWYMTLLSYPTTELDIQSPSLYVVDNILISRRPGVSAANQVPHRCFAPGVTGLTYASSRSRLGASSAATS